MLTTVAAGRIFDFSHAIGRTSASGLGFRMAVDVAVGDNDVVYVLNRGWEHIPDVPPNRTYQGTRVGMFTIGNTPGDEELIRDFAGGGDEPGHFMWATSMALDSQQNVYVTDEWLNRVSIFDKDGNFLRHWGSPGSGNGEFTGMSGIAVDQKDNLYIVDSGNNRVQVLTSEGRYLAQWGSQGDGPGQFNAPWGIFVDQQGSVYVVDHKNHRVQKFTADGQFLMQFGSYGTGKGQLNRPSDVAVDPDGDVYVCDWANSRVQVFGGDGAPVTSLVGDAQELSKWAKLMIETNPDLERRRREVHSLEAEWRFAMPTGLAFDPKYNRILVCDTQRQRLQIYNKLRDYSPPSRTI